MQQFPLSAAQSECFQTSGFGNVRPLFGCFCPAIVSSNIANLQLDLGLMVCLF
jgi:hypothetical protein